MSMKRSASIPLTARITPTISRDRFDLDQNVNVRISPSESFPSSKQADHLHIPIEVELSDHLLNKLLQQSEAKKSKLGHIRRVAERRLSHSKNSEDNSKAAGSTAAVKGEEVMPQRQTDVSEAKHTLEQIEKLIQTVQAEIAGADEKNLPAVKLAPRRSLIPKMKNAANFVRQGLRINGQLFTGRKVGKRKVDIELCAGEAAGIMYSYKARYVKNRDKLIKDGSVREGWNASTNGYDDYCSPRADDYGIDYSRYESPNAGDDSIDVPLPKQEPKKLNKRGRLVTFYKNGDKHFKGLNIAVNQKQFVTFEALLDFLSSKLPTTTGVKSVYSWPNAKQVLEVKDIQNGQIYVCSETLKLDKSINYGEIKATVWHNKKMSATKFRREEQELLQYTRDPHPVNTNAKPRILTIISNADRTSREKVMLNPQTNQTFEEILSDIGNMVYIENPPVTGLFTAKRPHKKVFSFSQLFKDYKDQDVFLAVGRELVPVGEHGRAAPQSTQSDSAINFKSVYKRKPGRRPPKQREYDSDSSDLPPRSNLSVPNGQVSLFSQLAPPTNYRQRIKPPLTPKYNASNVHGRRRKADREFNSIRVDIHNQRRGLLGPTRGDIQFVLADIFGGLEHEFHTPSNYQAGDGKKPDKKLQLEWVYGYRGRDARKNLYVLPSGELMYYVASVAVLFNRKKDKQRHYLGHNEDITSMMLHPNEFVVATGQASGANRQETAAHVRIWDARSLVTYAILGFGVFHNAIGCLAFSIESDGQYLMVIDESEKRTLSVWSWEEETTVVKTTLISDADFRLFGTASDTVVWGAFHPFDDRIIITHGKQHIYFWKIFYDGSNPTRLLRDKLSGIFTGEIPKFVTTVSFTPDGDVLSGDSNGNITLWTQDNSGAFAVNKRASANLRQAHKKSVFCLHMFGDGTLLSGGGHEIKRWDSHYRCKDVKRVPESFGFVRTLIPAKEDSADSSLYVGTTKSCILEGALNEKFRSVVQGHSEELWALTTHPEDHTFVTAGYDQSVCKWSAVSHKILWRTIVDKPCLSVCHNHNGRLLVIGTTEGRFIVLDARNGSHLATIQVGAGAVDSTKFSPDGRMLAMGAQDGNIYIYDVVDGGQYFRKHREGTLRGHKNFVMQLDWSDDSDYLQSVSGDYDLLFWNVQEMQREKNPAVTRDISWATQSCILSYSTAGAWTHLENEDDDINIVCKSNYEDYLAVGDNQGALRMYKYPASTTKPDYYEKKLYSSHVTNLKFMFDDSYLLSTGGIEPGLMQWVLVESHTPR